jgi:hypothetical protein
MRFAVLRSSSSRHDRHHSPQIPFSSKAASPIRCALPAMNTVLPARCVRERALYRIEMPRFSAGVRRRFPCNLAESPCISPNCRERRVGFRLPAQPRYRSVLWLWRGESNWSEFRPAFAPLGFRFEAVETIFVEFVRALTRKSLGGHSGVNIFRRRQPESIAGTGHRTLLSLRKPEQLPLCGPVGGEFEGRTHQALRTKLRRVFAVDDRRDDIGR